MNDVKLIFIIDDDIVQNEIHSLLIKKIDPEAKVLSFVNSEYALDSMRKGTTPDIIFLDLNIPGDTISTFLQEHQNSNLASHIYLMSSATYLDESSTFTKYPAVKDFISKPLLAHKLDHVLQAYA
jgi:response regulator of citrate/malate metabolism